MFQTRPSRLALLAAFQIGTFPLFAMAQDTAPAPPAETGPAIVVTQAGTRLLTDRIIATGSIKAIEEIHIQPQVEGLQIRTLNADTGDRVKEGDVLAVLADDSLVLSKAQLNATKAKGEASLAQLRAQLVDATASAEEARRQRERSIALSKNGTVSTAQVETAEATATSTSARVKAAEQAIAVAEADLNVVDAQIADVDLRLARTEIRSPATGVVTQRNARVGAIAAASGTPLFTLIRDGEIELVADVPETDLLRIAPGLKATLRVAGTRNTLTGSVRLISPTVDPATRLGSVHISIDEDDRARAGMYATADIVLGEANGLSLPLSAINSGKGQSTVRIVRDGIVNTVKIETGIQDGSFVEVKTGLSAGEEVVARAGAFVRDGDRVTPVRQAAAND